MPSRNKETDTMNKEIKHRSNIDWDFVFSVLSIMFALSVIALEIYCWVRYGNAPADQVPNWVWWLMWRR